MKSEIWTENAWYVAAFSRELQGNVLLARKFLGTPVVMYRKADGRPVALEDSCAHRKLPLSFGHVQNDQVVCGYHGMTFAPTGREACMIFSFSASIIFSPPGTSL